MIIMIIINNNNNDYKNSNNSKHSNNSKSNTSHRIVAREGTDSPAPVTLAVRNLAANESEVRQGKLRPPIS